MGTVNGLPAHILLVHAIVVLLPLTSVILVLTAVWPAARRRLALPNALLAVLVVILVPITTSAGEWLEHRVDHTALMRDHAELGDTALWFALPVALLALAVWWRDREAGPAQSGGAPTGSGGGTATMVARRTYLAPASTTVTRVIAALAVVFAVAAVVDTYLIGDSGARAAWTGNFSDAPTGGDAEHD
ncbi:DUF2231 domain-containing protein [Mangrovihabitans endophyticus]|uniref:DUF2231 domain-containing protein n=1 Tax=Mangrovihabitans endophyticus TaxID=1751298 RepID=A0A8J3C573_9ACTN|nr:DUF2231 domain-containing protein [Mangrovihabitans endophyticus]GGL09002.1 hypothetical protein GCM10012284_49560 [Mangrovihabitans endophyticus]